MTNNNQHKSVLIAGGKGLIGSALANYLNNKGYSVSILSRSQEKTEKYNSFYWNPDKNIINLSALEGQDYIINLTGENIAAKYWTKNQKTKILASRINPLRLLNDSLRSIKHKPIKIISASAIGYYGNRPGETLSETSTYGDSFVSEVCRLWESEACMLPTETIIIRIGIVLSKDGGYLSQMIKLLTKKLNIICGNGEQMLSWIHINDLVSGIHFLLKADTQKNIYNCVAPNPFSVLSVQNLLLNGLNTNAISVKVPKRIIKM
jgi:uncharacterized protein (TIGR01777 family)